MAQDQKPSLSVMENWARNPSDENWQLLLTVLTDIYLANVAEGNSDPGEIYADVACRLLDEVSVKARVALSERVAPENQFPGKVILRLAHDEDDEVAKPVLELSPALTQNDLAEIVSKMAPERSLAISKRATLNRQITTLLVMQGDVEIIRSVTANPGATFSDQTYRKVAEKAKSDEEIRRHLVERIDMPPAVIVQITPFLSDELKKRLKALDEPDGGSLLDSLSEITNAAIKKKPVSKSDRASTEIAIEQVKSGASKLDETAGKIASSGRLESLTMLLAAIANVDEKFVIEAFSHTNGGKFATICRALGISNSTFAVIAQLRAKRLGVPSSISLKYVEDYAKLATADAIKTLAAVQKK